MDRASKPAEVMTGRLLRGVYVYVCVCVLAGPRGAHEHPDHELTSLQRIAPAPRLREDGIGEEKGAEEGKEGQKGERR